MVRRAFHWPQEGRPHACVVFRCVPQPGRCLLFSTLIKVNLHIQLRTKTLPASSVPHHSSFEAISRFIPPLNRDPSQTPRSSFNQIPVLSTEQGSIMSVTQVNYSGSACCVVSCWFTCSFSWHAVSCFSLDLHINIFLHRIQSMLLLCLLTGHWQWWDAM